MPRQRLTAERVRTFECPPGARQVFLWDSEVPGLAVRATPGAKAFVFQAKLGGKTLRVTLGDVRAWSIEAARDEARLSAVKVHQGIDPRIEKVERLAAAATKRQELAREELTLGEVWPAYIDANAHRWSPRHLADHHSLAQAGGGKKKKRGGSGPTKPGPLAPLMPLRLAELTPKRVASWAKREAAGRPTRTQLACRLLKALVNWCEDQPAYQGLIPTRACSQRVMRVLPRPKAKSDCLQREQLKSWFDAVRREPNPVIAAFLQGLLLTGARRGELARLQWDDLDFRWRSMRIKDKVDGERVIPLCPYLAALLAPLPRRNLWVFSSPQSASGKLTEPRKAHSRALAAAGIEGLTLHGLRRSFGTLAEWVEVPAGVVAQIMGHKPSATAEKHYRVRPLDLLRKWHKKIEEWILEQAGIEQPGEEAAATGLQVVK